VTAIFPAPGSRKAQFLTHSIEKSSACERRAEGVTGVGEVRHLGAAEQRAQWLRDLATLDRIERQREELDPCFFSAMGELHARTVL